MELADVLDSKSSGSDTVRVRPPLPAPKKGAPLWRSLFLVLQSEGPRPKQSVWLALTMRRGEARRICCANGGVEPPRRADELVFKENEVDTHSGTGAPLRRSLFWCFKVRGRARGKVCGLHLLCGAPFFGASKRGAAPKFIIIGEKLAQVLDNPFRMCFNGVNHSKKGGFL